jgi:predicted nucleic acid-binding protein
MPEACFADTFYWVALASQKDAWHSRVAAWAHNHPQARLVTTEEILTEVLNWFAATGPAGRFVAVGIVRRVLRSSTTQVLPQSTADFAAALAFYEARPDKEYSLIDCRSMVAMRALGLTDVLTNDHHFTQEGFTIHFP